MTLVLAFSIIMSASLKGPSPSMPVLEDGVAPAHVREPQRGVPDQPRHVVRVQALRVQRLPQHGQIEHRLP